MDPQKHILVVDDELDIREPIGAYLEIEGFSVSLASNAAEAMEVVETGAPDLVVLDIMLGRDDGLLLCRDIQKNNSMPVIFLSGRAEETERIIGLEVGADDYIVKPFNPRELLARIKAVLRRYQPPLSEKDEGSAEAPPGFGQWRLDFFNQELVSTDGETLPLSTGEARLLKVFVEHPNEVLSRDQLLELSVGRKAHPFDRSIDNYVSRIRKKIEEDPSNPRLLKTYRSGGYALNCGTD
jgi:two-component system OmpR family response regulator